MPRYSGFIVKNLRVFSTVYNTAQVLHEFCSDLGEAFDNAIRIYAALLSNIQFTNSYLTKSIKHV